jgi:RHS repeat-associated protein
VGPFAYDPSGNVAIIGGSYSIYDPMSRLVTSSVQRPDQMGSQVNTYGYDVYGNRTTVDGVATYAASTATNRLTGVGAVYDAAGNLTQWQPPGSAFARQYTYDSLDMITNEVAGGQLAVNIYTPDDERLWRFDVSNTVSHWTVRDLGGKVLRDFLDDPNDSNGAGWTLYREYIYRNGQLLAVNTPTGTEHDSLDHLGSPRLVTDGNRNRIFHHHYLPFGGEWTIGNESADGSTLRFTGHERDDDPLDQQNGTLDYMHARFYSANLGRFVSVDPAPDSIALNSPQSWNRYTYAANNPLLLTDPTGRCPICEPIIEIGWELISEEFLRDAIRNGIGLSIAMSMASEEAPKVDAEGRPIGDEPPPLLGTGGAEVDSKTLWPPKNDNPDGLRIDVENPEPGGRSGQVQIQRNLPQKETYVIQRYFDQTTRTWGYRIVDPKGGPVAGWVAKLVRDPAVQKAITKGMVKYLNEIYFTFTRLYL